MVGGAAYWVRQRGWKAVLGGPCPFDPLWLDLMGERGVLAEMRRRRLPRLSRHLGQRGGQLGRLGPASGRDARDPRPLQSATPRSGSPRPAIPPGATTRSEQARRFARRARCAGRAALLVWLARPAARRARCRRGSGSIRGTTTSARSTRDGRPKLLARLLRAGGVERLREVGAARRARARAGGAAGRRSPAAAASSARTLPSAFWRRAGRDRRSTISAGPASSRTSHWLRRPPRRPRASGARPTCATRQAMPRRWRRPGRCSTSRRRPP